MAPVADCMPGGPAEREGIMFNTLLVPVDGSKHADKAVAMAADLAAKYDAKLWLFHVLLHGSVPDAIRQLSDKPGVEEPGLALGGAYVETMLPRDVLEDIAAKLLERSRATAAAHGARRIETAWGQGNAATAILAQAREVGADTVVMGARGLSDLEGLLVGSVSHKVAHLFEGTVVTVK